MKPFKMFFGISIAVILFLFVARILFVAFIIAAVMSIIYAVFRRLKDFVNYDRYGKPYIERVNHLRPEFQFQEKRQLEPLFYDQKPRENSSYYFNS